MNFTPLIVPLALLSPPSICAPLPLLPSHACHTWQWSPIEQDHLTRLQWVIHEARSMMHRHVEALDACKPHIPNALVSTHPLTGLVTSVTLGIM